MELRLRNELSELERLAAGLETFGEEHGLSPKTIGILNVVLDELVTNAITHGQASGVIVIRITPVDGVLEITMKDEGAAFNPLTLPEPDLVAGLEERKIGGLGIHFVRK